ncbi:unnamed protein product, partial [Rotaria magnacalcarata]
RTIKSIRQFAAMNDEERRSMLRSITDEQYDDIMNVLSIYPHITMTVSCGVFDDEDEHIITTGAVVTLTIHLQRENMSTVFNKELGSNTLAAMNTIDYEANEEQADDKENREKTNETSKAAATASNTTKGWNNKSDKKKKTKKKGHAPATKTSNNPSNKQVTTTTTTTTGNKNQSKSIEKDSSDDDSSKHSDDSPSTLRQRHEPSKDETNNSENENNEEEVPTTNVKKSRKNSDNDEDTFLERFQQQQRKRETLETKAKISHRVFCPFYPEIKQECWWLYVADKKHFSLISAPVYLCTLKDKEEIEIKFSAPKIPGHYVYSVILRSDSYFDVDVMENLAFDVQAAKEMIDNHPQWDFSDEEGATNNKAEDEEFATEKQTYQHNEPKQARFHVAEFNFDHVADVYSITLWILLGSLAKVGFHLSHRLTEKFPESCLLIILGLIVGGLLYGTHLAEQKAYVLDSNTFFLFLLP